LEGGCGAFDVGWGWRSGLGERAQEAHYDIVGTRLLWSLRRAERGETEPDEPVFVAVCPLDIVSCCDLVDHPSDGRVSRAVDDGDLETGCGFGPVGDRVADGSEFLAERRGDLLVECRRCRAGDDPRHREIQLCVGLDLVGEPPAQLCGSVFEQESVPRVDPVDRLFGDRLGEKLTEVVESSGAPCEGVGIGNSERGREIDSGCVIQLGG